MEIIWGVLIVLSLVLIWYIWHEEYTRAARILSIYVVLNKEEEEYFYNNVYPKIQRYAGSNFIFYLCNDKKLLFTNSSHQHVKTFTDILQCHTDIDVLVYSGHSTGAELGHEHNPIIKVEALGQLIRSTMSCRIGFVYFDSCNMGTLNALSALSGVSNYIIGTPNFYDWDSILEYPSIYQLTRYSCRDLWSLDCLVNEYVLAGLSTQDLREICIYEPGQAPRLHGYVLDYYEFLQFDNGSQIEEDLYDLYRVLWRSQEHLPKDLFIKMMDALFRLVRVRHRNSNNRAIMPSCLAIYNEKKKNILKY